MMPLAHWPLTHWNGAWIDIWMAALVNHLWQSTSAVLLAWLLAWSLRANPARTRYWVWMAASIKFLLPFSMFIAAGEALRAAAGVSTPKPALSSAIGCINAPFPQQPFFVPSTSGSTAASHHGVILGLLAVWICGVCVLALRWARSWRQLRAAVRAASPISLASEMARGVPVLATTRLQEPGVFGIVRPVLLLPQSITRHLSPEQLRIVVAHELCHVRRRDNLTAALHMAVTALFWFHPAVWWIEARLLAERERACDEAVLAESKDTELYAELYAESILSVCKFYAESPLACVPGVTGGDLKQRIVRIMTGCMARELSAAQRLAIAAACVLTVAVPVAAGLVGSAKAVAQSSSSETTALPSFEVASIRPNMSGKDSMSMSDGPARYVATDTTMVPVLWSAFGLYPFQFVNVPSWLDTTRYDIEAKIDDDTQKLPPKEQRKKLQLMVRSLLMERCNLRFHRETRMFSVYSLQLAKGSSKLHPVETNGASSDKDNGGSISVGNGEFIVKDFDMESFATNLGLNIGHVVEDQTGLQGRYSFKLEYAPDRDQAPTGYGQAAATDTRPPIFTALQEQLGLKLVSKKAPLEVIVIDHIEPPTPN